MKKTLFLLALVAGVAFSLFYGPHGAIWDNRATWDNRAITGMPITETKVTLKVVENKVAEKIVTIEETAVTKAIEKANADIEKKDRKDETGHPTVIRMEDPIYKKHLKKIAIFNHLKHADYNCGECHHNAEGAPLSREVIQAQGIKKCSKCHNKVGKRPTGLSKKERLGWHKETLHQNCKSCHRKVKKEGKVAPTTCKSCHTK